MANSSWSESHGDVELNWFIVFWLNFSKGLSKPFILLKISPNQISILSVLISIPLIFSPEQWWFVLIALVLDGVDGQVAIARNLATKQGSVIDSLSDRIVEFIWALALYLFGLNPILVAIFIGIAWLQEYLRARAGGLGYKKIGIVTVSERPTRAIFVILALILTSYSQLIITFAVIVSIFALATITYKIAREINL